MNKNEHLQTTATVNLHDYHRVVISSSGGKDSQAQLTHLVELARTQEYPLGRVTVSHADLGRSEWAGTGELVHDQAGAYGVEVRVVKRPQGDLLDQIEARGMWPSSKQRYCTSDQKRGQLAKVVTGLHREAREAGHTGTYRVLECLGMRGQESPARAKLVPFSRNTRLSTKTRQVDTWLPIHAWTVEQVWETINQSGLPHHRAYDLGMPRLSCVFCIFSPKAGLVLAGRHNRQLLVQHVELEKRIGHSFRKELPLADVLKAVDEEPPQDAETVADWTM